MTQGVDPRAKKIVDRLRTELNEADAEWLEREITSLAEGRVLDNTRTALRDLMKAHQNVFGTSMAAAYFAGKQEFVNAWKQAESALLLGTQRRG